MSPFIAEFVGTMILLTLGAGVCCNVALSKTNGHASGWIVIAFGWSMAVYVAVACVGEFSGAHLNPAVTISLAVAGLFKWSLVPMYILAQILGAMAGATLAWLAYRKHFDETEDQGTKLGVFATGPSISSPINNVITEAIGTFVLAFTVLYFANPAIHLESGMDVDFGLGALGAMPAAFVVLAIGLSLGGPTGYAINPARDFGPRLVHALLPIKGKGGSNWGYAWIPVVGPIIGCVIAAQFYLMIGH